MGGAAKAPGKFATTKVGGGAGGGAAVEALNG